MAEYIDKQAFNDAIREAIRRYPSTFYNGLETARRIAHDMDTADVQPVRHGRWIIDREFGNDVMSNEQMLICSECGKGIFWGKRPYCPNCGARMDGGETDER